MVHRDEYRQMLLAGTVSFPATFPQVGKITLEFEALPGCDGPEVPFLSVAECPSARVTLTRRVTVKSVRAVFVPRDPRLVAFTDGEWLLDDEILPALSGLLDNYKSVQGIVFVPENEPSILKVSAGMTAGESVQYYPPLPNDPAHNHYNAWPTAVGSRAAGACMPLTGDADIGSCSHLNLEMCETLWSCATADEGVQLTMQSAAGSAQFHASQSPRMASLAEEALWSCNAYDPNN